MIYEWPPAPECKREGRGELMNVNLPSGETTVFDVAFRTERPLTVHFTSAGGFDGSVTHCSGTVSPTRASVAPLMVTCAGATSVENGTQNRGARNAHIFRCLVEPVSQLSVITCPKIEHLHKTVKSISAFNGVCDIMLLASHLNRALLSFASAVNE